ncbi:hypothetical protein EYF80_023659 [Liparis tanakae]|uniref:Uncharacterized protein n=1 Tax=Liparis tanakae TaxID=230148 RepID=A0A4Z2HKQ5_9TELE|nr:hypothetical protein EYF80_023659 [Liparis tanakae]
MGDERSQCLTLVRLQKAVFKAAGLNAGLIAQLSSLCDLPQLAGKGHRTHAVRDVGGAVSPPPSTSNAPPFATGTTSSSPCRWHSSL